MHLPDSWIQGRSEGEDPAARDPDVDLARRPAATAPEAGRPGRAAARPRITREARGVRLAAAIRGRHLLALDVIGCSIAAYLTMCFEQDRLVGPDAYQRVGPTLVVLLAVRLIGNVHLGLYRRRWRWASVPDLERIAIAMVAGTIVTVAIVRLAGLLRDPLAAALIPTSFWPSELLLSAALLGGARFGIRILADGARTAPAPADSRKPTLLYGAGDTGALMSRWALRTASCGVLPVGFLDDDPQLAGSLVGGLPVYGGLAALPGAVMASGARRLLITMPTAPGAAVWRVVDAALSNGLEVRTVPALVDLLDGTHDANRVRRVRVEDLLRRPVAVERAQAVQAIIRDRTILITGAAGSIGSELARQVHSMGPRRLVLVDRSESPLYLLQRELEALTARGRGGGALRIEPHNVASRALMERLVRTERPDVVLHAAAYKHVPMMEEHPSEAVQVNVGGTLSVLDACVAADVERLVLVSTDKAVRPSSAMGASKRLAELLVADAARTTGRAYATVRFGNVLGSAGSVVPILQDELAQDRPLTITDPEMTRFFMTIPEAAWLILDAAAIGRAGGDLFVLDMGEPVRIIDLAYDLVRLAGRDPESQPFEIVGLRPGEKLHEQLAYATEQIESTASPKVLRLRAAAPPATIRADALLLLAMATGERETDLRRDLMALMRHLETRSTGAAGVPSAAVEPVRDAAGTGPAREAASGAVPAGAALD